MSNVEIVKSDIPVMVNPETLIEKAIEKDMSIEGLQKLLDMRLQIKAEYAKEEFFKALSMFQKECPVIEKKKSVKDRTGTIMYKYAPIEDIISQVLPALESNGFSFTFKTMQSQGTITVKCEAHHAAGHTETTEITVPLGSGGIMSGVQQVGSATTYAKRYSFCNQFGILTGDEDNDGATGDDDTQKKEPPKPQPPAQNQTRPQQQQPKPQQAAPAAGTANKEFPYMLKDGDDVPAWFTALPGAEKIKWAPKGFSIRGGKICAHKATA